MTKEMIKDFIENDRIISVEQTLHIIKENFPNHIVQKMDDKINIWTKDAWESDCELAGPATILQKMSYSGYPENQYFTGLLACCLSNAIYVNWAKKQHRTIKEKRILESLTLLESLDILFN